MTDDEMREAILKHLGWCRFPSLAGMWMDPTGKLDWPPSYVNNLEQIHQLEKTLKNVNELGKYADILDSICVPVHICNLTHWQSVMMSTARQRAEAYLKTVGKWRES